jgi:SAM-dependent methyltransferase
MIKQKITTSKWLNFNLVERDDWIVRQSQIIPTSSSVIDVGAGSCPYRLYFSHCQYQTQDFTALSPEQLRGRVGYDEINYICDATSIPVPNSSFDVVLCTEVLEHVPEPIKVVHEFSRILKPGGKLLLTAPLGSGIHQEPYHYYGGYTPYWYQKFLAEAGFTDISVEPNGGFFKHYGQESIRLIRMTTPWTLDVNPIMRLVLLPIWLAFLPLFALFLPFICYFLDNTDKAKDFTIGYHVVAVRKSS